MTTTLQKKLAKSVQAAPTVVVQWNQVALEAIRQTHPGPPMVARMLAIVHTAIHYLFKGKTVEAWAGPGLGMQMINGEDWQPYQASTGDGLNVELFTTAISLPQLIKSQQPRSH